MKIIESFKKLMCSDCERHTPHRAEVYKMSHTFAIVACNCCGKRIDKSTIFDDSEVEEIEKEAIERSEFARR